MKRIHPIAIRRTVAVAALLAALSAAPFAMAQGQVGGCLTAGCGGQPSGTTTQLTPPDLHPDLKSSPGLDGVGHAPAAQTTDAGSAAEGTTATMPPPDTPASQSPPYIENPPLPPPPPPPASLRPRSEGMPLWGVILVAAAALICGGWLARRAKRP